MASTKLLIAPAARGDLSDIYQYNCRHWGKVRAIDYLNNLKEKIWQLQHHPESGVTRGELHDDMRSLAVGSHVIFYRFQNQQVEIVRILHGRQDPDMNLWGKWD